MKFPYTSNFNNYSNRSSRPDVLCKKTVLQNFTKFTGKHLCQSLFAGLRPANLLKKRLCQSCFPVNFLKFLRTSFHIKHLWWLLLLIVLKLSIATNYYCSFLKKKHEPITTSPSPVPYRSEAHSEPI